MIKKQLTEDLNVIKSWHIPWALGVKTLIQIVEIWIALTITIFLWNAILKILSYWIFDEYNWIFNYFAYLFWYDITVWFTIVLCALFVVMAWRWAMSWASNNWWQTPNNNWN